MQSRLYTLLSIGAALILGVLLWAIVGQLGGEVPADTPDQYTEFPSDVNGDVQTEPESRSSRADWIASVPAATPDELNEGHYFIGPRPYVGVDDPSASDDPPYVIEYSTNDNSFTIALLHEPLAATRRDMQAFLSSQLRATTEEMCRLNYTVSVPAYVNDVLAGRNLGFSFCPGATPLE